MIFEEQSKFMSAMFSDAVELKYRKRIFFRMKKDLNVLNRILHISTSFHILEEHGT